MQRAGRWGLYPWFEEHGADLVDPNDLTNFRTLMPYGKVFKVVDEDADWLTLAYRGGSYRVHSKLFQEIPPPPFDVGEAVRVRDKPERTGRVLDITWHHKEGRPVFFLSIDGKKSSRRYWAEELERAAPV